MYEMVWASDVITRRVYTLYILLFVKICKEVAKLNILH